MDFKHFMVKTRNRTRHKDVMVGGVDIQLQIFWNSPLNGREWSVSCPGHITTGKEPPHPWVGLTADRYLLEKYKFIVPA